MTKPTVVVAHPIWGRGGAEVVAMHVIEALSRDFDVTLYTRAGFDVDDLNWIAGTSISRNQVQVVLPAQVSSIFGGGVAHRRYLDGACRIARHYDLRVTASGSINWGVPAVQFLSSLVWHPEFKRRFFPSAPIARLGDLKSRMASRVLERVLPQPFSASSEDLFVANSEWTAAHFRHYCGGNVVVVHPGIVLPNTSSETVVPRNKKFICFGRISPEKKVQQCIEILEMVNRHVSGVTLDIIGSVDSPSYYEFLNARARRSHFQTNFCPPVYGTRKESLFTRYSFGINCCEVESFGISTAELTAAGVIVFAPLESGQREILPTCDQLFVSEEDAVQKIVAVIADERLQGEFRCRNREHAKRFAIENFNTRVRQLCIDFMRNVTRSCVKAQ